MSENIIPVSSRAEFREWLVQHHASETECYVYVKRGRPADDLHFWYLDAVEEALCFGWVDSTLRVIDGKRMQRFSPRRKNGSWTELNKERVRRLERLGLMTDAGRAVLPDMGFAIDPEIERDIRSAGVWEQFTGFPQLYQRVRAYNLSFTRKNRGGEYAKSLEHFVQQTRAGKMFGEWNDYGRLL